jgi:hypothetical protein
MNWQVEQLEREVTSWPGVSASAHRFAGREFRFRDAEIGHVHAGGVVDIPYPRAMRDAVLAAGLAQEHAWVPNSGWITFHVRHEDQMAHAIWLMRLSYARYAIKHSHDAQEVFEKESRGLQLQEPLSLLLRMFVRTSAPDSWDLPAPVGEGNTPNLHRAAR